MIYVPSYNNNNCAVLTSSYIRVYSQRPTQSNQYYSYREYYYNSHYSFNDGTQYFSTNSSLPSCRTDVTSNIYYRNDFSDVLITFIILAFIILWLPWCLMKVLFRK